jgi:hypothetical protein
MRPPSEQKIPKQREWPILRFIALSMKLQVLLAGLHLTILAIRTTRRWEAEGLA